MTHMDLLLWRHAEAQDGQDDLARPLTEHGHRQAKRIARWLERHAPEDLRRCCSPARRARETLEAWTQDYELLPEAAPGAAPLAVLAAIGWPELERPTLIVGHHVGLDMSFLNRACRTHHGQPLANPCLDTMRMAMLWREKRTPSHYEQFNLNISYVLTDLAEEFDLPRFTAHEALGDALQTAYLFIYLAKKIARNNPLTLRELFRAGQSWRWYM